MVEESGLQQHRIKLLRFCAILPFFLLCPLTKNTIKLNYKSIIFRGELKKQRKEARGKDQQILALRDRLSKKEASTGYFCLFYSFLKTVIIIDHFLIIILIFFF